MTFCIYLFLPTYLLVPICGWPCRPRMRPEAFQTDSRWQTSTESLGERSTSGPATEPPSWLEQCGRLLLSNCSAPRLALDCQRYLLSETKRGCNKRWSGNLLQPLDDNSLMNEEERIWNGLSPRMNKVWNFKKDTISEIPPSLILRCCAWCIVGFPVSTVVSIILYYSH